MTKSIRNGEHGSDFIIVLFPGQEKVAVVHIFKMQLVQFVGVFFDVAHGFLLNQSFANLVFVFPARNTVASTLLSASR